MNIRRGILNTYSVKAGEIEQNWVIVDANGKVLGRLASEVASILKGKHKPTYSTHADCGDHVVIVNAEKVRVTGKKAEIKRYYRHTGYPGGLRSESYEQMMQKTPEKILEKAIWGMLPHNRLGRKMYKKLRVYAGDSHPHEAQKPEKVELG